MVVLGGVGNHIWDLTAQQLEMYAKLSFVQQFFYALVVGLVKLSVTWNIKRIFEIQRGVAIAAYVTLACSTAWILQTMLVPIVLCQPISMNWAPSEGGHCGNSLVAYTSIIVVDILTDLMVLILPIPSLLKLQIANAYKIPLFAIFGAVLMYELFPVFLPRVLLSSTQGVGYIYHQLT